MEYGQVVGQSTEIVGGRRGSDDITGQVMNALGDAVDHIATLPPEVLVAGAVLGLILLVFIRR